MSRITLNTGTQHQYTPSGVDIEGQVNLNKLSDVTITQPLLDNQILIYDTTTSQWENGAAGDVTVLDLEDLTDVTITGVTNGQVLKYDTATSKWVNGADSATVAMADITDVTITALTNGQALQYNTTTSKWENADIIATVVDGGTY
jgi:hypothetical protein